MGGVRSLSQKALHNITGQRVVSLQEAVFMVDDQPLVLTSEKMTYLSLNRGQEVRREDDGPSTDVISKYRNRSNNKLLWSGGRKFQLSILMPIDFSHIGISTGQAHFELRIGV